MTEAGTCSAFQRHLIIGLSGLTNFCFGRVSPAKRLIIKPLTALALTRNTSKASLAMYRLLDQMANLAMSIALAITNAPPEQKKEYLAATDVWAEEWSMKAKSKF
jgi:hypothetical protein